MGELLIRSLVLVAIAAFVWWVLQPKYDFTIQYEKGEVEITGGVPQAQHANLTRFLRDDISLEGKLRIRGRRRRDGRLTLVFNGPLDASSKQRIRNFLMTII